MKGVTFLCTKYSKLNLKQVISINSFGLYYHMYLVEIYGYFSIPCYAPPWPLKSFHFMKQIKNKLILINFHIGEFY
jgi:hypothetical protein